MMDRTTLADALHQAGQLEEAEQWFRQAEAMQKERQPEYHFLYSLRGYKFCDLLLSRGKYREVMERAEKTLEWDTPFSRLLDIGLHNLSLGRAWMKKAVEEGSRDFTTAMDYLNRAAAGLREAGQQQYLAPGLLIRAECYRLLKQYKKAWEDLNEAEEIAESGGMKLYLCDLHLEAGRLCLAEEKNKQAEHHFSRAKKMIEETGYFRRREETQKRRNEETKRERN
jgi:tetratricopeptide (TPR) repeat protein